MVEPPGDSLLRDLRTGSLASLGVSKTVLHEGEEGMREKKEKKMLLAQQPPYWGRLAFCVRLRLRPPVSGPMPSVSNTPAMYLRIAIDELPGIGIKFVFTNFSFFHTYPCRYSQQSSSPPSSPSLGAELCWLVASSFYRFSLHKTLPGFSTTTVWPSHPWRGRHRLGTVPPCIEETNKVLDGLVCADSLE